MKETIKIIKKVGLTGKQCTKIYAKIEREYKKLQEGRTYSAPEVIK